MNGVWEMKRTPDLIYKFSYLHYGRKWSSGRSPDTVGEPVSFKRHSNYRHRHVHHRFPPMPDELHLLSPRLRQPSSWF